MTEFCLAHFSDPHLSHTPRLNWRQRLSKRQLSAWSWQRSRQRAQQGGILEALVGEVRASQCDHIAITGDITNFSLAEEFTAAMRWLEDFGAPDRVTVVPGNHDALVALDADQGLGRWRRWMSGDEDGAEETSPWPFVRRRGNVALIGLNSALPTLPGLATGRIGAEQLAKLEAQLHELGGRGLFRIVLLHHPVADGAVSARKALADRAALREVLRRVGAELVLHGHARDARFDTIPGPAGPILCLGLPSSSAAPGRKDQGARWQRLRVQLADAVWMLEVVVRIWQPQEAAFVSAGTFSIEIPRSAGAR